MIKKICLSIVVALFIAGPVISQIPNPVLFNTASNSTGTGTLAVGSNDLNWTVCNTGSVGVYIPAIVCGNQAPCCWVNSSSPNVNWITYPHGCSASPAEHSCLGAVDEYYKLSFNLPANTQCGVPINQTNAYCLALDFYADNCVWEIFVNGVSSYLSTQSNPYFFTGHMAGNQVSVSLCNNWQAGNNEVILHIKSGAAVFPTWSGLLAVVKTASSSSSSSYTVPVINTNSPVTICSGQSASLSATGAYTYTWNPGNIIGSSVTVSPSSTTIYTVTGATSNGCSSTATLMQTVSDCMGINSLTSSADQFVILPNPNSGQFTVGTQNERSFDVNVINGIGQLMRSVPNSKNEIRIDICDLPKGMYFVLISSEGTLRNTKVIVE